MRKHTIAAETSYRMMTLMQSARREIKDPVNPCDMVVVIAPTVFDIGCLPPTWKAKSVLVEGQMTPLGIGIDTKKAFLGRIPKDNRGYSELCHNLKNGACEGSVLGVMCVPINPNEPTFMCFCVDCFIRSQN